MGLKRTHNTCMKRVGDVDPVDVANLQTYALFTSWVGLVGKLMKNGLLATASVDIRAYC